MIKLINWEISAWKEKVSVSAVIFMIEKGRKKRKEKKSSLTVWSKFLFSPFSFLTNHKQAWNYFLLVLSTHNKLKCRNVNFFVLFINTIYSFSNILGKPYCAICSISFKFFKQVFFKCFSNKTFNNIWYDQTIISPKASTLGVTISSNAVNGKFR